MDFRKGMPFREWKAFPRIPSDFAVFLGMPNIIPISLIPFQVPERFTLLSWFLFWLEPRQGSTNQCGLVAALLRSTVLKGFGAPSGRFTKKTAKFRRSKDDDLRSPSSSGESIECLVLSCWSSGQIDMPPMVRLGSTIKQQNHVLMKGCFLRYDYVWTEIE